MEKVRFMGLDFNRVNILELLFSKTMILGFILFAIACFGVYEMWDVRYFSAAANAHASGLDPTSPALKQAMKLAVFGDVGEVNRNIPWTLFIVNYMYMIYTGSGIIFLVALAELLNIGLIARAAAGFMVVGIAMVFAGLFTIATDLNMLNMHWMFLTPNVTAGMWLMLPLYCIYIPFVLFEIYLLLTHKREWAKRLAFPLLVLSVGVDVVEYYIQAKLFSMNTARHLWTEFPVLTLYFILSSFVASLGVMGVLSFLMHRKHAEYDELIKLIGKAMLFFVSVLALYEVFAYMTVDKDWAFLILFGEFRTLYFIGYIFLALAVPFLLLVRSKEPIMVLLASISAIIGGYAGRYLFVYGGNANPMSNRFGVGYEKYDIYALVSNFNYVPPHLGEVLIVVGSVGIVLIVYKLFDAFLSVGELKEEH